jgi:hypothetical protein
MDRAKADVLCAMCS